MPRTHRRVTSLDRSQPMRTRVSLTMLPGQPDQWRIEPVGAMSVPGIVFASEALLPHLVEDQALQQVANVATLPGIVEASYAMPDVHWGYGFPIGGVAATDVDRGEVISPGGVGFDISCGVRLLVSPISVEELEPRTEALMDALDAAIPRGLGGAGVWHLDDERDLTAVLREGAKAAVQAGLGTDADLSHCEDGGMLQGANPSQVSERALARGLRQVGSLGSGNHFLEVQVVDAVYDAETAKAFGLAASQVCVMIHSGSRGLGHQICSDHVRMMLGAMSRYEIWVTGDLVLLYATPPLGRCAATRCAASSRPRASRFGPARLVGWLRRRRSPTRTWTRSWQRANELGSPGESYGCGRSVW